MFVRVTFRRDAILPFRSKVETFRDVDEVHYGYTSFPAEAKFVAIEGWITDDGAKTGSTYPMVWIDQIEVFPEEPAK